MTIRFFFGLSLVVLCFALLFFAWLFPVFFGDGFSSRRGRCRRRGPSPSLFTLQYVSRYYIFPSLGLPLALALALRPLSVIQMIEAENCMYMYVYVGNKNHSELIG